MQFFISALLLLLCLRVIALPSQQVNELLPRAGGGWKSQGLPYSVSISSQGCIESLVVNGFEFLAPSPGAVHGIYCANGDTPLPFTSIEVKGNTLYVSNDAVKASFTFLPERIAISTQNIGNPDGLPLRIEFSTSVSRVKNVDSGVEYALPLTEVINKRVRLIAPNGANVTSPGEYLFSSNNRYLVKTIYAAKGWHAASYALEIAPALNADDTVKISARAATDDYTYRAGDRQVFFTDVTNMLSTPWRGSVILRMKSYLTKAVVHEERQPLTLATKGAKTLTWTLDKIEPGVYMLEIWSKYQGHEGLCGTPRILYDADGLHAEPEPEDFAAFWKNTLAEQERIPLDLHITKVKDEGKSEVYKFDFAGLQGRRIYGWLVVPQDKSRPVPGMLILPSSGNHAIAIPSHPDGNIAAMAINISNLEVDLPQDDYDIFTWPAPYLVTGIYDKSHYTMRFSYAGMVRAAELLASRSEVDPNKLLCYGGSQGGGLTIICTALYGKFKAAVADVPGLCRLDWNLTTLHPDYFPIAGRPDSYPILLDTLAYYDATQFAKRITCPIWISVGLLDDVTPAIDTLCAYNAIPGKQKHLLVQPYVGHGGGYGVQGAKGVWP